jgi:hypothetical protein
MCVLVVTLLIFRVGNTQGNGEREKKLRSEEGFYIENQK